MVEQLRWVKAVEFPLAVPKRAEVTLPDNHAQLIYLAKVAEQSERFDEMVACMRKVVMMSSELSVEERNLLSMAYKNVIGSRRSSWRIASSIEGRERERGNNETIPLTAMYRAQFEEEVGAVCDDIIGLLDTYLVPAAQTGEAKVFYLKMKGDYHRYHAEITSGNDQKEKAHEVYKKALEVANSSLAPTHPIRLGLVLNFSVFYYEILKERTKGVELAQQAYANASSEIDALEEEDTYKEASLIMQLLRDNLTLWAEESEGNADQ